jgi:hypothetical protein
MQRYNSFKLIHKGLRAALYETALKLQQTDFIIEEETEEATNNVKEIIMLFHSHASKEDHFVLPAINDYEPSVVAAFEADHEKDHQLMEELNAAINKVVDAQSLDDRAIAGTELNLAFVRFMVFNLEHMAREEDVINKILWRYYTDEEIKAIGKRISDSVEPWLADFFAKWMLRGISNREAVIWLKAIEASAPAIVFQTLINKAEQELPDFRYRKVAQELTEGIMLS